MKYEFKRNMQDIKIINVCDYFSERTLKLVKILKN